MSISGLLTRADFCRRRKMASSAAYWEARGVVLRERQYFSCPCFADVADGCRACGALIRVVSMQRDTSMLCLTGVVSLYTHGVSLQSIGMTPLHSIMVAPSPEGDDK
jgi:hypothetical protein